LIAGRVSVHLGRLSQHMPIVVGILGCRVEGVKNPKGVIQVSSMNTLMQKLDANTHFFPFAAAPQW